MKPSLIQKVYPRVKAFLRPLGRIRNVIERRRYHGCRIHTPVEGNELLASMLRNREPGAVAKLGASELGGLRCYLRGRDADGVCTSWGHHQTMLYRNAGVYPADPAIHSRFCREFLNDVRDVSVLAVWFRWGERSVTREYAPSATYVELTALEPMYHDRPWSGELAGKRVLVITPFAETVRSQYPKRREIWKAHPQAVLPELELDVLRTPLSAALVTPEFPDWFSALDHFKNEMAARTWDVALIGAGAWSLPLAVHARRLGRWGIHLGGGLQLLFGIRGRRWDGNPQFTRFFNDAWVRPQGTERPNTVGQVEEGCYW